MHVAGLTQCHVAVINLISANAYAAELGIAPCSENTLSPPIKLATAKDSCPPSLGSYMLNNGTAPLFD